MIPLSHVRILVDDLVAQGHGTEHFPLARLEELSVELTGMFLTERMSPLEALHEFLASLDSGLDRSQLALVKSLVAKAFAEELTKKEPLQ